MVPFSLHSGSWKLLLLATEKIQAAAIQVLFRYDSRGTDARPGLYHSKCTDWLTDSKPKLINTKPNQPEGHRDMVSQVTTALNWLVTSTSLNSRTLDSCDEIWMLGSPAVSAILTETLWQICAKMWIEGIFLTFSPHYKNGADGQRDTRAKPDHNPSSTDPM